MRDPIPSGHWVWHVGDSGKEQQYHLHKRTEPSRSLAGWIASTTHAKPVLMHATHCKFQRQWPRNPPGLGPGIVMDHCHEGHENTIDKAYQAPGQALAQRHHAPRPVTDARQRATVCSWSHKHVHPERCVSSMHTIRRGGTAESLGASLEQKTLPPSPNVTRCQDPQNTAPAWLARRRLMIWQRW